MKKINLLLGLLLCSTILFAQKRVAVFDPVDDNNSGMGEVVREILSTGLTNTSEYVPVERAMIEQVLKENKYQASGLVDESRVSELGKQMGADFVCVSLIKQMGTNFFITAKLVDVTTSTVILQKYVKTAKGKNDFFEKIEELTGKLFGERSASAFSTSTDQAPKGEQVNKPTRKSENAEVTEGFLKDNRDGKSYKTVKIGNQVWMAENLAYKEAGWTYANKDKFYEKYGQMYSYSMIDKVCPAGWHVPSNDEWKQMEAALGNVTKKDKGWQIVPNLPKLQLQHGGWGQNRSYRQAGGYGGYLTSTLHPKGKVVIGRKYGKDPVKIAPHNFNIAMKLYVRCVKN